MRSESHQRGVVLIFALIVLLILAVGAVALLRSMNTSMVTAGNLAFHRDLVNQGEQAVSNVLTEFKTAAAPLSGLTSASNVNANYSANALTTNPNGVPLALLNQTTFNTVGIAANDIAGATSDVTVRYVIDRLCSSAGVAASTDCVQSSALPNSGTDDRNRGVPAPTATVYRISVRVSGPRNTQAFLQTTFTKPD
jgi:Tfp pilus assembly protein PilX